jgi:hypothetical protein
MKTMTEVAKRFVEEEKEVMDACCKEAGFDFIKTMDETQLKLMQQMFKLLDTANEFVVTQAAIIDEMNEKLNKLDYIAQKIEA